MKRIALSLALVTLTSMPVLAGGFSADIPRLDFPSQEAQVTQLCSLATQSCGK
ncbi:MAG: hypothetical protein AB7U46_03870 [Paenirhodobacter sp.]|uniref:hypothetical protein n=1 Tax=Paenirhodobacter sp. TaxID=1965326 RepID=UPI003D09939E